MKKFEDFVLDSRLPRILREWRLDRGFYQKDVANLLFCDRKTISNWERGKNGCDVKMLNRIWNLEGMGDFYSAFCQRNGLEKSTDSGDNADINLWDVLLDGNQFDITNETNFKTRREEWFRLGWIDLLKPEVLVNNEDGNLYPIELKEIVDLFSADAHGEMDCAYCDKGRLFVRSNEIATKNGWGTNGFMLRYHGVSLVICHAYFLGDYSVLMNKLYGILVKMKTKYDYKSIQFELICDDENEEWCKQNGFVPFRGGEQYTDCPREIFKPI